MSFLVFIVAIAISAVAAYYSIVGLVTIFAASVIPVAIMGSVLEVGKLVTASWLYQNWKQVPFLMKSYLTIAVVVLMLITSMGIFGFLSKAHIEQTAIANQNQAVIERTDDQITQITFRIEELQEAGVVSNEQQNAQIVNNQQQIEQINARYEELINEQNAYINEAKSNLDLLDRYIEENDVRKIQALVGAKVDGQYGSGTARRVEEFRERETEASRRVVSEARSRIAELRNLQLSEVNPLAEANRRLQAEIGRVVVDTELIAQLQNQVVELNQKKFELETEYRKLEAEFGPIKYISELIYGDDAEAKLDESVRIVILMLIFVFDPLAVLLLIASNHGYKQYKERKESENVRPMENVSVMSDAEHGTVVSEDDTPRTDESDIAVESDEVQTDESAKEKIVRVKDADVEVKYDKEKDEFQFVTYPTDIKDDRNFPEIRKLKEE